MSTYRTEVAAKIAALIADIPQGEPLRTVRLTLMDHVYITEKPRGDNRIRIWNEEIARAIKAAKSARATAHAPASLFPPQQGNDPA